MQIYVIPSKGTLPQGAKFPCIVLVSNTWDDFGYKTLFTASFWIGRHSGELPVGDVKILNLGARETDLPASFSNAPFDFVSLGQSLEYYKSVRKLNEYADDYLDALNDLTIKPQLLDAVETNSGFRNSLIRFNDAKIALRDGAAILRGRKPQGRSFKFKYTGQLPGAELPISIDFALDGKSVVPGRLAAIIGKNGAGKTQFLAQLARDLANTQRTSLERREAVELAFQPERPLFSRVIALSFSAFDKFSQPEAKEYFSYIYCGVRSDSRVSVSALEARHLAFLKRVKEQDRTLDWEDHVNAVLGSDSKVSLATWMKALAAGETPPMSSGQSILIYFISAALAYVKEDSLILFDEPETHLHPNAVAALVGVLQSILSKYDSYAIVATHSPVFIQETPGKHVVKFEREGAVTVASRLDEECFGDNISDITRYIFETVEIENFYKETFKKLLRKHSASEVERLFGGNLSLHALAYLASKTASKANDA